MYKSKISILVLVMYVVTAMMPATVLADRRHYDYKSNRHANVIVNVINVNHSNLDFARKHRYSLRDLMYAQAIADLSRRADVEDVLRKRSWGWSNYKIAKHYHVRWHKVERRVDDMNRDLRREFIKVGLTIWALDRIID